MYYLILSILQYLFHPKIVHLGVHFGTQCIYVSLNTMFLILCTSWDGPYSSPVHVYVTINTKYPLILITYWDGLFRGSFWSPVHICPLILSIPGMDSHHCHQRKVQCVSLPGPLLIIYSTNSCFCFSYSLVNISRTTREGFQVVSVIPNHKTL